MMVVLEYPLLQTKFQVHWFQRRKCLKVFTLYMYLVAILVMWHGWFEHIFFPPPLETLYEILSQLATRLFEEMFEIVILYWVRDPGLKVKEWPWPLVLTNFHDLIKTTLITNFRQTSSKHMKTCVLAFPIFDLATKKVKVNQRSSFEQSWMN